MNTTWQQAQEWEKNWHGNCVNSLGEELKQIEYAKMMGLKFTPNPKTPYNIDLEGKSVLDIGGGAYSLLLKCSNFKNSAVVDPLMNKFPKWVLARYMSHQILPLTSPGETLSIEKGQFDEVWFYNVLEHTFNPQLIIENAKKAGKIVRVFEWLDTRTNIGHPQTLRREDLDLWLGGEGKVEEIRRGGLNGKAYFGVFKGDHYE